MYNGGELIKTVYTSKCMGPLASFEQVRLSSMGVNTDQSSTSCLRNPQLWLPPESALERHADLVSLQIAYLCTAGVVDAPLINFLSHQRLRKSECGKIEYDFGHDVYIASVEVFISNTVAKLKDQLPLSQKGKHRDTPQKGRMRKLSLTSTPKKKT